MNTNKLPQNLGLIVVLGLVFLLGPFVSQGPAAALTWDPLATGGNGGGSGTWDTGIWWSGVSNGGDGPWSSGDDAVFGGTAGTVTIANGVSANNLFFNTSGYSVIGSTLTLTGGTVNLPAKGSIATIGSVIAGNVGLIQTGSGSLNLAGPDIYSGTTAINGGTLNINSTNATTAITVGAKGALGGMGSASLATATISSGGSLDAGFGGQGSLTLGGLNFSNAASVYISNITNYTTVPAIDVIGNLTASNSGSSVRFYLSGAPSGSGVLRLLYAGAGASQLSNASLNTQKVTGVGTIVLSATTNPGYIDAIYSGYDYLVWTGSGNGTWTTAALAPNYNWKFATAGNGADFQNNETVVFSDSAATTNVNITAPVGPASVAFNNNLLSYTLSGTAGITGQSGLTINGSGGVTVTNSNSYIGPTAVNAGTLQIGNGGSGASIGGSSGVTLAANTLLIFNHADGVTFAPAISGAGSLVQTGSGLLTLPNNNTFTGGTAVNGGTLALGSPLGLQNSTLTISSSGALSFGSLTSATLGGLSGPGALSLGNTAAVALSVGNNNASTTYSGTLSGPGSLTKIGAGALTLAAPNSFAGTTMISGGAVNVAHPLALENSTVNLSANNSLVFGVPAATLGGLSGSGSLNLGPAALTVGGNNANSAYSGTLSGGISLTKTGSGTLTLTAPQSYNGPTLIAAGTVQLGNAVATTLAGFGANTTGGNFTGDTGTWTINSNGAAYTVTPINNNVLTLTDNVGSEARSAFYDTPVPVAAFSASFVYQAAGTRAADGVAFMLQNDPRGLTALGGNGGGLGSGTANAGNPIASSAGIGLNIYAGAYSGNGLYLLQGGLVVATNSTSPVTLGSGDPIQVNVSYDGSNNLTTSMLDLSTSASFSATYPIGSLTSLVGSNAALMGFSGATGGAVSTQTISNFFYSYGFTSTAVNNVLPTTTALSVAGGATFDLVGNNQTVGSLSGAGTVTNSNPGTVSVLTTGGDNSSQTFSGSLQNGGGMLGLTKTGSGSLTLTGLNLYSGGTTVSGGTLQLGDGATFNGSLAGNIVNNSAVVFANPLNQLYSGAISGSGSLTKTGPGTLQLTGNDAYTGPTVINAGAVRLGGAFVSGFGANTTGGLQTTGVAATGRSNGTWSFNSYSYNYGFFNTPVTNNVLDLTDGTWSTASAGQYGSGEARSAFYQTPVPVNTSFRATFTYTPSYPGGSISAGTANYDNGFAFILQNQGLGALGGAGRGFGVGSDPEGAYNNYPISPSAEIEYDIFQGANAYSQPTGAATGYNTNGGTNTNISIFGGNSYVPGDPINMTVAYNAQTQVLTWSGTDAGLGLTFSESQAGVNLQSVTGGSTALIGFTGANGFDDSTQSISNFTFAAVNAGNVLPATTSLYISSNGTLDLFGSSQTVASLSGAGMVTNSNTVPSTLTVSPSSTSNFNGTLQDGAAPGGLSLVLNGPGILILSGTDSYLGGTTVEEGTLILASPTALAEGTSLTVGQGASSLFAPASAGPALAAEGVASVPEPGTLALLLAAALGSASVYRRSASKRRRSA